MKIISFAAVDEQVYRELRASYNSPVALESGTSSSRILDYTLGQHPRRIESEKRSWFFKFLANDTDE